MPSRVKAAEVMAKCTICSTEIRMTKTNTEARQHSESKHPSSTFAICFPGHFDPTAPTTATPAPAAATSSSSATAAPTAAPAKKKAAKADLSFLDASVNPKK